mmetsp:Transcript_66791/g.192933  ORF Transcript_66791/g.192933 Transcript_66791/m.192933 type:complete len:215 (+) Transcript_66791:684-1328(+)
MGRWVATWGARWAASSLEAHSSAVSKTPSPGSRGSRCRAAAAGTARCSPVVGAIREASAVHQGGSSRAVGTPVPPADSNPALSARGTVAARRRSPHGGATTTSPAPRRTGTTCRRRRRRPPTPRTAPPSRSGGSGSTTPSARAASRRCGPPWTRAGRPTSTPRTHGGSRRCRARRSGATWRSSRRCSTGRRLSTIWAPRARRPSTSRPPRGTRP